MAEVQVFEPEFNVIFTDRGWRAAFAGQTGIVCDTDGSAFGLTLPPEGSTAEIGSPSIPSRLVVDGFGLEVPAATTQSLDIPASVGGGTTGRTDLIVGRLTTGPVNLQLHRIPGTEGSTQLPAASYSPTGTRDLLLYAIRRREGQGLNQAIVTDLRPRIGLHHLVPAGATLPALAPLGDRATRAGVTYRSDFVEDAVDWVIESRPPRILTYASFVNGSAFPGWIMQTTQRLDHDGRTVWMHIDVLKSGGQIIAGSNGAIPGHTDILTVNSEWRPPVAVSGSGFVTDDSGNTRRDVGLRLNEAGRVRVTSTTPGAEVKRVTGDFFYRIG